MLLPKKAIDLTGQKYGHLTAIEYSHSANGTYWKFMCECGASRTLRGSAVAGGHQTSCGCQSRAARFAGEGLLEGQKIGLITAVKMAGKSGHNQQWEMLCSCGGRFVASASNVLSGNTKSCGCLRRSVTINRVWKHGMSTTRIYGLWHNMIRRCTDTTNPAYLNYGGRGIKVCDRWIDFSKFYLDMGDRPRGMTLDRKDNDGPYSPENCRWSTHTEQARNTRANTHATIGGETKTVSEWGALSGIPRSRIYARKALGWNDDELLLPKRPRRK